MAKSRSDSLHMQTAIMQDAIKGIKVPDCVELEEEDMPFFRSITDARTEWTTVDLIHAANLARCMASIERNSKLLKEEGDVIKNERGTPVMNPRFAILEQLSRRSVAISVKIQVHAAATIGEVENNKARNSSKRNAINAIAQDFDDLIARPVH